MLYISVNNRKLMLQIGNRLFSHPVKWKRKEIMIFSQSPTKSYDSFVETTPISKQTLKSQAQELL